MAKKKKEDPYDSIAKDLEPKFEDVNKYLEIVKDTHNDAISRANKKIKYDLELLDDEKEQDKYIDGIHDELSEEIFKGFGYEGKPKKEDLIHQQFLRSLGVITKEEMRKIFRLHGKEYANPLRQAFTTAANQFAQSHYAGIITPYTSEPEQRKHVVKFLDLENKINHEIATHEQLARLAALKGLYKEIPSQEIPEELKLPKKKKKKSSKKGDHS